MRNTSNLHPAAQGGSDAGRKGEAGIDGTAGMMGIVTSITQAANPDPILIRIHQAM